MSKTIKAKQCNKCLGIYYKERKECPFCAELREKTIKRIKRNIDTLDNSIFTSRNTRVIAEYAIKAMEKKRG